MSMGLETSKTQTHLIAAFTTTVQAICETLWPTRCAICDEPGSLLCERCKRNLPYIDFWRACPRCGAPFGRGLCTECNPVALKSIGLISFPFSECVSVLSFGSEAAQLVGVYKDRGERRLAEELSRMMIAVIPPNWLVSCTFADESPQRVSCITFIPATHAALRRRGYDHAELLAQNLSTLLEIPLQACLARPTSKDQRALTRRERGYNMRDSFSLNPDKAPPPSVLLIDDVCTTGATLAAAAETLLEGGAQRVVCLTFARVW